MMLKVIFAALALVYLAGSSAWAQSNEQYAGYTFPNAGGFTACSPDCTGVRLTIKIPTFSGAGNAFVWPGLFSFTGDGGTRCGGGGGCLAQFGLEDFGGTQLLLWWELFCQSPSHGTGCGAAHFITGMTANTGDTVIFSMNWQSGSAGTSNEQDLVTINDTTTGNICYVIDGGNGCGSPGSTINMTAGANNEVYWVLEDQATTPAWSPSIAFSNVQYATGSPGSQTWHTAPLTAAMASWHQQGSVTISPSAPFGINTQDFNICTPVTSAVYNPCGGGPFTIH
jgi:hypothetical protein